MESARAGGFQPGAERQFDEAVGEGNDTRPEFERGFAETGDQQTLLELGIPALNGSARATLLLARQLREEKTDYRWLVSSGPAGIALCLAVGGFGCRVANRA